MSTVKEHVLVGEDMPISHFWTKYLHSFQFEYKGRGMTHPRFQTELESILN